MAYNLLLLFILKSQCSIFHRWEAQSSWILWLLTDPHHSSGTSLLWGTECSRLILYIPYPSPQISHFSTKRLGSFTLRNIFRNQDWASKYAHSWCFQTLSVVTARNNIVVCIYGYLWIPTYTYIYYILICVFTYINNSNTTSWLYFLHW